MVTGAARGIGLQVALDLAEADARIVAVDSDHAGLEDLQSRLGSGSCLTLPVDLLENSSSGEIVETTTSTWGALDILVNCAGVFPSAPALEIPAEEWDRVMDTNLRTPFLLSQAAARWMVETGKSGSIVNIASAAAVVARPGVAHYCASKAGLVMLTKALAVEWAEKSIRVNAVAPGLVETPGVEDLTGTSTGREEHRRKISHIPLGRAGEPDEISAAVLYLVSDSASFVTGETLFVDGGYSSGRTFRTL